MTHLTLGRLGAVLDFGKQLRLHPDALVRYPLGIRLGLRREAGQDYDFDAREQINDQDKAILQDAMRPIVIFNPRRSDGRWRGRSESWQSAASATPSAIWSKHHAACFGSGRALTASS